MGARRHARIRSYISTLRKHDLPVLEYLRRALDGCRSYLKAPNLPEQLRFGCGVTGLPRAAGGASNVETLPSRATFHGVRCATQYTGALKILGVSRVIRVGLSSQSVADAHMASTFRWLSRSKLSFFVESVS